MSPQPDSPLRHRAFVQFWCARVASGFGFQMLSVAVGWQIYAITGRAFDLGLIGLVQFIPSVLLALPAGHVADQYERRRVVLIGQVVEWTAIVLLAVLTLTHRIHEQASSRWCSRSAWPRRSNRPRCSRCCRHWCRRRSCRARWR